MGDRVGEETEYKVPDLLEFTTEWGKQTLKTKHQVIYTLWKSL